MSGLQLCAIYKQINYYAQNMTKKTKKVKSVKSSEQKLTAKQALFVKEYLIDLNATQAAIRAGYSENSAAVTGCENLIKPNIQNAIQKAMQERKERTEITADSVLKNILLIQEDAMQQEKSESGVSKMVNHAAALKAGELLGKHLNIFVDRKEITGANGAPLAVSSSVEFVMPAAIADEEE